jgi:hypothetical protein
MSIRLVRIGARIVLQGKSFRLIVGSTPAGFYDRWARLFAKYMPKYIPGNPAAIWRGPC